MRTFHKIVAGVAVATTVALTMTMPAAGAPDHWVDQTFIVDAPDGLFVTHSGDLPLAPFPAGIPRFTEPELRTSFALGSKLRDAVVHCGRSVRPGVFGR